MLCLQRFLACAVVVAAVCCITPVALAGGGDIVTSLNGEPAYVLSITSENNTATINITSPVFVHSVDVLDQNGAYIGAMKKTTIYNKPGWTYQIKGLADGQHVFQVVAYSGKDRVSSKLTRKFKDVVIGQSDSKCYWATWQGRLDVVVNGNEGSNYRLVNADGDILVQSAVVKQYVNPRQSFSVNGLADGEHMFSIMEMKGLKQIGQTDILFEVTGSPFKEDIFAPTIGWVECDPTREEKMAGKYTIVAHNCYSEYVGLYYPYDHSYISMKKKSNCDDWFVTLDFNESMPENYESRAYFVFAQDTVFNPESVYEEVAVFVEVTPPSLIR